MMHENKPVYISRIDHLYDVILSGMLLLL